jgi:hypothetical protein
MYELVDLRYDLRTGVVSVRDHIGDRYDWLGLLWGLFRLVVKRLTGWRISNVVHSDEKLFCSEFVVLILKNSVIPGTRDWVPESVSPAKIRKFLLQNSLFKKVSKL